MASLRKEKDRNRVGWRLQFRQNGIRRSLWLGAISKRAADTAARHIDLLVQASSTNSLAETETVKWAADLKGRIRLTLQEWGLVEVSQTRNDDADRFLASYCDRYIESRTDVEQVTRNNYGHAKRLLVEYFGERRLIGSITAGDAERWRRFLLARPVAWDENKVPKRTMALATVSKHVKRTKTMFDEAVKDQLLASNPFKELKTGSEANRDRDHFVDRTTSYKVLTICPDDQWRLIFALARFGGLRRCELLTLTWNDILWDTNRMRINSPKTGTRFCPIFPELVPYLQSSFELAPEGSTRVIYRYHQVANLGTQMNRIIEQAGVAIWEKTFQNLRATRRTELQEKFQDHVINAWMGHSSATAAKHYLQVTDEHFNAGTTTVTGVIVGGVTGGVICADPERSAEVDASAKSEELQGFDESEGVLTNALVTPLGLEPRQRESKSLVLPLHHGARKRKMYRRFPAATTAFCT